jgi:flavin reductase (DIM6/NTAB) family NADH-FMN oxidoreductase RutF
MSDSPASLFRCLTNGVYVVGVAHEGRSDAFTAAWITQVSFDPLLLGLSINPEHASYALLRDSQAFAVNVLKRDQLDLARHFGTQSGRDRDKLSGMRWRLGEVGAPVLLDAAAYLECRVTGIVSAGDHELVLGQAIGGSILASGVELLSYADTGNMDGSEGLYPPTF